MQPTVTKPPAPHSWPFGQLTPLQQQAHDAQLKALQAGELRRIPTVFGDLDEVPA
jgi:hypothetical protein